MHWLIASEESCSSAKVLATEAGVGPGTYKTKSVTRLTILPSASLRIFQAASGDLQRGWNPFSLAECVPLYSLKDRFRV